MKAEQFTIPMTRLELTWLHRQIMSGRDQADALVKQLSGPQADDKQAELTEARNFFDEMNRLEASLHDRLIAGNKERAQLNAIREELEEALELNPFAAVEIRARLDALPKEEPYRVTFDRETAKFTLKLIEKDLTKFKTHVIPSYEKKSEEDFPDVIQTKTYWINKARKAKTILDNLRVKLERES